MGKASENSRDARENEAPSTSRTAAGVVAVSKAPPPETPKDVRTRRLVIAAFWSVIIIAGLPLWWQTTTIYRAALPLGQMMDWAEGKVSFAWA